MFPVVPLNQFPNFLTPFYIICPQAIIPCSLDCFRSLLTGLQGPHQSISTRKSDYRHIYPVILRQLSSMPDINCSHLTLTHKAPPYLLYLLSTHAAAFLHVPLTLLLSTRLIFLSQGLCTGSTLCQESFLPLVLSQLLPSHLALRLKIISSGRTLLSITLL